MIHPLGRDHGACDAFPESNLDQKDMLLTPCPHCRGSMKYHHPPRLSPKIQLASWLEQQVRPPSSSCSLRPHQCGWRPSWPACGLWSAYYNKTVNKGRNNNSKPDTKADQILQLRQSVRHATAHKVEGVQVLDCPSTHWVPVTICRIANNNFDGKDEILKTCCARQLSPTAQPLLWDWSFHPYVLRQTHIERDPGIVWQKMCGKFNNCKKKFITSMVSTPSFDIEATRTCINSGWVRSRSLNRQFVCCLYFWCNYTNLISCVIWKFSDGWTRKVFDPRIFHGLHSRVCLFPSPELCTFSGTVCHYCT